MASARAKPPFATWNMHRPIPEILVTTKAPDWGFDFQEVRYGKRGSWDVMTPRLHIAALTTPARHHRGKTTKLFRSLAPSSSVAVPGQEIVGGWEGGMVGLHLIVTASQFERITGREFRKSLIHPYSFTSQSETNPQVVDVPQQLLGILADEAHNASPAGAVFAEQVVNAILQYLVGDGSALRGRASKSPPSTNKVVNKAIDYIRSRLCERTLLSEIADECGVSVQYLCRVFKSHTGCSPHRYIVRARVNHARALIQSSGQTLAEIAIESGFADQSQMSTAFRKVIGANPSSFRD